MAKPDGGPAFPVQLPANAEIDGMSLRDYFAAAALPALIAEYMRATGACMGTDHFRNNVPTHAYAMADALLKERAK